MLNQSLRYAQSVKQLAAAKFSFNKRFLNLNVFIFGLIVILVLQTLYSYSNNSSTSTANQLLFLKNEVYSSIYDSILNSYDPKEFQGFEFEKKCDLFFDHVHKADHSWILNNFDTQGYDDNYINFQDFLEFKKSAEKNLELTESKIMELQKEFDSRSFDSVKVDKKIIDAVTILRVFGNCFIDSDPSSKAGFISSIFEDNSKDKKVANSIHQDLCHDTEARIFPWLSNILPTYTRWDGEVSKGLPNLSDDIYDDYEFNNKFVKRSEVSNCFVKNFKNSINGKGIVISASDSQKGELMRLALILRALDNTLPIQIVHKGDLSIKSQNELIQQFRKPISTETLPLSFSKLSSNQVPKFPAQDVWFVNVRESLKKEFDPYFEKYANKLLAYLFNSFEDMILIDTDTVPFVNLANILKLPGFLEKGAFFFQDRQLRGSNTQNQVNYFKRLFPSKLDNYFFNVPQVTDFTLKNRFIGELRNHYMESGVVAIKRSTHFTGLLLSVQLNFWSPTTRKIHGDKELFWLGQSIAGNENYEFNSLGAASLGEITPLENTNYPNSNNVSEVCGNHPGHVNGYDNTTLLWMNSGFTFCKNTDSANFDAGKPLFKNFNSEKLKTYYKSTTKIRAAIVPPPQEIDGHNQLGNPEIGWTDEHKYCYGYTWCAYNGVGSMTRNEEKGLLVEFDEEQNKIFDFFGELWMNGINV